MSIDLTSSSDAIPLTGDASNKWEELSGEVPIQTNGYIYIYVANETMDDVNVHFDDIEVTLIESPANHASDYYPFGLVMDGRSWSSEPYRFGYQGQFSEYDEETGWNAFELRMYDSKIGRWLSVDPARQFPSPYVGMGNMPIIGVDPDGGFKYKWQASIYAFFTGGTVEQSIGGDRAGEYYVGKKVDYNGEGAGIKYQRTFDTGFDVEVYGDVRMKAEFGLLSYNDVGPVGSKVNFGAVELGEIGFQGGYSLIDFNGEYGEYHDYVMNNENIEINQSANLEVPLGLEGPVVDSKIGAKYLINPQKQQLSVHSGYVGGGIPWFETRTKLSGNNTEVRAGLQEDWGKSLGPIGIKGSIFLGIKITVPR